MKHATTTITSTTPASIHHLSLSSLLPSQQRERRQSRMASLRRRRNQKQQPLCHCRVSSRLLRLFLCCCCCYFPLSSFAQSLNVPPSLLVNDTLLGSNIVVGGFVDSNTCWTNLQKSDANQDGAIDRTEYITFCLYEAPDGVLSNTTSITTFDQLPTAYQLAFVATSCLCNNPDYGGDATLQRCCLGEDGKIRIPPNPNDTTLSDGDSAYLYAACVLTSAAADDLLGSPAPTVMIPPPTSAPFAVPSIAPSVAPSIAPSTAPSIAPVLPTMVPSVTATTSPSSSTTDNPSTSLPSYLKSNATVAYEIAIRNGTNLLSDNNNNFVTEYVSNLQVALNRLVQTIEITMDTTIDTDDVVAPKAARTRSKRHHNNGDNNMRGRRILQQQDSTNDAIRIELPTTIQTVTTVDCAGGPLISSGGEKDAVSLNRTTDLCQEVTAVIQLIANAATNISVNALRDVTTKFENDVYNSIYDGNYQKELDAIYQNDGMDASPIIVLTGLFPQETPLAAPVAMPSSPGVPTMASAPQSSPTTMDDPTTATNSSLSPGAISAIVLGASVFVIIPIILFLSGRMKKNDADINEIDDNGKRSGDYQEYQPDDDGALERQLQQQQELRLPSGGGSVANNSQYTDFAVKSQGDDSIGGGTGRRGGAIAVGASQTQDLYKGGPGSRKAMEAMMFTGDDDLAEGGGSGNSMRMILPGVGGSGDSTSGNLNPNEKDDASSNAGSSGWSSSAGISSLNTGSIDDSSDIALAAGATLAGIGLASATFRQQQDKKNKNTVPIGAVVANTNTSSSIDFETTSGEDDDDDDDDFLNKNNDNRKDVSGAFISSQTSETDAPTVTRDQLDSLIESGDWAAVGATAALLAAASDSQSATTGHSRGSRSLGSRGSSVDAARAAELDHLVDAGDWEGVVMAAAKFEAATETSFSNVATAAPVVSGSSSKGSTHSRTNSSHDSTSADAEDSATGTGTFTGTFDPSLSTSVSDDPSRAAKLAEYRAEVEALVRRVVPEEIDNVDEMMNQFKGREEELVETLRTMQERAVAQKARQAGQKSAKLEARRSVQRGVVPGAGAVAQRVSSLENQQPDVSTPSMTTATTSAAVGSSDTPLGTAATTTSSVDLATSGGFAAASASPDKRDEDSKPKHVSPKSSVQGSTESHTKARSALDAAIEAGDWEAVRDTAAALSVSSGTSVGSSEIDRLANTNVSTTTSETPNSRRRQLLGVNTGRAAQLDAMIEAGDWEAVVSVANQFSEEDKKSSLGSGSSTSKMSKEEEEALREAELWMKIAEQKKAEGATDAGASDAAEWAIQRSLSQLREADMKSKATQKDKFHHEGEDEV